MTWFFDKKEKDTAMEGIQSEKIRRLVDKLHEFGVQQYVDLPQIAVMGDTSSGKSSVLTALSGIQFPSADKLTTRCPTQLILSHSKEFTGKVHIQRFNDKTKDSFPSTLQSIDQVPEMITNLTQKLVNEGQEISDDAIVIEASGPDFPNLTLTDLPGLVRAVSDGEDKGIIQQIRNLVNRYLSQSRTVILAVAPANVDMHNTEILQAAKEADPSGDRTIAIITKLDLVDPGAEDSVVKLLNNETKKLKLGYHAVRCRGQQDLKTGMTVKNGLKKEKEFFRSTVPWNTVGSEKLGIPNLRVKLVQLLEQRITESLPAVCKEIQNIKQETVESLNGLGPALTDLAKKRSFFLNIIHQADQLLQNAIFGQYDDPFFDDIDHRWRAMFRKACKEFNDELLADNLKLLQDLKVGDKAEFEIDTEWYTLGIQKIDTSGYYWKGKDGKDYCVPRSKVRVNLNEIIESIADSRGEELPAFPSYSVFKRLARDLIMKWKPKMLKLLQECEELLRNVCAEIASFNKNRLSEFISLRLTKMVDDLVKNTEEQLTVLMDMELVPFTLNHYFYDNLLKLRQDEMERKLRNTLTGQTFTIDSVIAILKQHGVGTNSNEYQEAYDFYLALVAYEKVAKKRFIDMVPMTMDIYLAKELAKNFQTTMQSVSDEVISTLLAENPESVYQRNKLEAKLDSMEFAEKEISIMCPSLL